MEDAVFTDREYVEMKLSEWWRSCIAHFGAQTLQGFFSRVYSDYWLWFRDTEGEHATRYVGMVRNGYWGGEHVEISY